MVPSTVTSTRDSSTRSPGRRSPNSPSRWIRSWKTVGSTVPVARTFCASSRASARSRRSRGRGLGHVDDLLDGLPQHADVPPDHADEHLEHGLLLDRVEPADRTEVDEAERAVLEDEHVARVGVGVEEAHPQDLFEGRPQERLGDGVAVDRHGVEPVDVGERAALEALLDEHPPGAELPVHPRHPDRGAFAEQRGHLGHGLDLAQEVELGPQALRELPEHLTGPHALAERRPTLRELGEQRRARPGRAR